MGSYDTTDPFDVDQAPTPQPTPPPSTTPTPTPSFIPPTTTPTPSAIPTVTPSPTSTPGPTPEMLVLESGDYDGDGIMDYAIFRSTNSLWAVRDLIRLFFGMLDDIPASGL